jgi:3-phosphoshikimate 1-carboxyvinyltransferase
MEARFQRSGPLRGAVSVPGDKSISHRAAIAAALAEGKSAISGFSPSSDCASTLDALRRLGVLIEETSAGTLRVEGRAGKGFAQPEGELDAGNSGTTMRLLAGALASHPLKVILTGDESLRKRPMQRVIEPLTLMGASISASDDGGHPPLRLEGGDLKGIDFTPRVASAQVKSAVLFAALGARGPSSVNELAQTRDHTERLFEAMGVPVARVGLSVSMEPGTLAAADLAVPGDVSSAAFLIAGALLCPGSKVTLTDVGLNPTRTGFLQLMERMGAEIETIHDDGEWEPRGSITAVHGQLRGIELCAEEVTEAIDEVTLIALLATQAEGVTRITGAEELRAKESDRISATVAGLSSMGASIEQTDDGMVIEGPSMLAGARVSSAGDHRLAMLFALAGSIAGGCTVVEGFEWTRVSFPGFDDVLRKLAGGGT